LLFGGFIISGHAHVKGEIARAIPLRLPQPQLERLHRFLRAPGANHFDKRRRAADQCRFARRFMRVFGKGAHEGQINVHVRIDEPWKNVLPARIDDLSAGGRFEVPAYSGNRFVLAKNVGHVPFTRRNYLAILDEERHGQSLNEKDWFRKAETLKL
jgi:hypothetical protein